MEVILDSAIKVATQYLEDFSSSVKELCESCDSSHTSQLLITAEDGPPSLHRATMATEGVWQAVLGCCGNSHILSNEQRHQLRIVVDNANALLDALLFLPHIFLQHVVKELSVIPLEVLCTLHSTHLLSIEAVLQASSTASQYILTGVIETERGDDQREVMYAIAEILCDLVLRQCPVAIEMMEQLPTLSMNEPYSSTTFSLMKAAVENTAITDVATQELASNILTSHLTHPVTSLFEAVSLQSQWQYSTLSHSKIIFYSDILSALDSTKFIELIQKSISIEQLNWTSLLQVMVYFLHTNDNAPNTVQELVKELIVEGMIDNDDHIVSCGLLLARQASLEGSHLFPSYQKWLKIMFGDSNSVIEGKKQLLFLLKVLTTFVPHDPVFALKAHINQPPHQIVKCLSQVKDYLNLVKTRLNDMGEKVPNIGDDDDDVNSDVSEAIVYYNEHGHISQKVIEASIFKLPYYRGRFLTCLLAPSFGCHSDRKNFINALTREKRIPQHMVKNYEKACHDLTEKSSSVCISMMTDEIVCLLKELPSLVKEDKSVKKLLSHLSHCLYNKLSQYSTLNMTSVKIIDDIISGVCEAVTVSTSYKWLEDMIAMLNGHIELHYPFYFRLKELLTNQLLELSNCQLFGVAVLTSKMFCLAPEMSDVIDDDNISLKTGKDYIISILSAMTPHNICMRFDCLFVEQLLISIHPIPHCLLHRQMMYMYRRQKFILTATPHYHGKNDILGIVDTLLTEYHNFVTQWEDCEVKFEEWLSWEMAVSSVEDGMSKDLRILYYWREVFEHYVHSCPVDYIFLVLFKSLSFSSTDHYSTGLFTVIQELSHMLLETNHNLSIILTKILQETYDKLPSKSVAAKTMMLALSLPPSSLFYGCEDTQTVADFIQHTIAPHIQDMMILPSHITHYLLLGVSTLAEVTVLELCNMSHVFLASLLVHWQILPQQKIPQNIITTATWLHSGMRSMLSSESVEFRPLAVAVWHYVTQHHNHFMRIDWLKHIPSEVVVLVSACCVHWLSMNTSSHHLQTNVLSLLQVCIDYYPSSVEAFSIDQQSFELELQHTKILTDFRLAFSCKPSPAFYQISLLRFIGSLPIPDLHRVVATAEPCFLWLCVLAHKQCLSFYTPLPSNPPLTFQPLSAEFIHDSIMALHEIVDNITDCSQLQNVLKHCHSHLKPLIMAKLNTQ